MNFASLQPSALPGHSLQLTQGLHKCLQSCPSLRESATKGAANGIGWEQGCVDPPGHPGKVLGQAQCQELPAVGTHGHQQCCPQHFLCSMGPTHCGGKPDTRVLAWKAVSPPFLHCLKLAAGSEDNLEGTKSQVCPSAEQSTG